MNFIKPLFSALMLFNLCAVNAQNVNIKVDAGKIIEPMKPIYAWFGYDEPNYTYMKDGTKLLTELSELSPVPVYVRAHNLMTSGDGTAALKWGSTNMYTEDKDGNPVYYWEIIDKIIDTYIVRGMKPLVEIGFMPEALSINPEPYQHNWAPGNQYNNIYTGWTFPPKSYEKWGNLVYEWVKHCVARYGEREVASWYFEVWNEPDIGYWSGTHEEYCMLYDYAADGVKRALSSARVGGPETTDPANAKAQDYLRRFLDHCANGTNYATGKKGSPLDYISFHAKGAPITVDEHVRMNVGRQLNNINNGFKTIAEFPQYLNLPVVIGESDPEGCAACSVQYHPSNDYRNGTMYSSYTAASFPRKYMLGRKYGVNFQGAVTWAFEFENQDWFAGFRDLATNGVDKPVLNVFRMFGMMKGNIVESESDHAVPLDSILVRSVRNEADIAAFATADVNSIAVLVWNYHDDDNLDVESANVNLTIKHVGANKVQMFHYRVDQEFSNSFTTWKAMGSPQGPSDQQYRILEKSGHLDLYTSPSYEYVDNKELKLNFELPRQGVSLIKLVW